MANEYKMTISRLTIDKLGVRLYDKVSAVISELISNSYDADAREVLVYAPMGQFLATKVEGVITDKDYEITIDDDGIGMTPEEINNYYLKVGAERRTESGRGRGDKSPIFDRSVMGRKGVGKLAPFGICEIIEILSSGGEEITRMDQDGNEESGYLTAHLILNRSEILSDEDEAYKADNGELDNTLSEQTGTKITLKKFAYRKVPDFTNFARQISQRFGISSENWQVYLHDTTKEEEADDYAQSVDRFTIETMPNTKMTFDGPDGPCIATDSSSEYKVVLPTDDISAELEAGFYHEDDKFYPIKGWMAYSKKPYKDDLMAGVRIYCRGKIAAQTTVFNRRAGFTGEHDVRSYLVGELNVDWLDETEDLILTDRRDILWSHELGEAFQKWGQKMILKIGNLSRDPFKKNTLKTFFEIGEIDEKIEAAYPGEKQVEIRKNAKEFATMLGKSIRLEEAESPETVEPLVQLSLLLAPHITLDEKLREAADDEATPLSVLSNILRIARIAELSSFGRIAADRIKIIDRVEKLKDTPDTAEDELQDLLQNAPWLINPEWSPVTSNKSFKRLKDEFEKYYEKTTGDSISLDDFYDSGKRPDFVLTNTEEGIEIVEIKRPVHSITNPEMDRIITYHDVMKTFLAVPGNEEFLRLFRSFHITLVCDGLNLTGAQKTAFDKYRDDKILEHITWSTFLLRTERMHKDFLDEADRQKRITTISE